MINKYLNSLSIQKKITVFTFFLALLSEFFMGILIFSSICQYLSITQNMSITAFRFLIIASVFNIVIYALCDKLSKNIAQKANKTDQKIKSELDMAKKIQQSMLPCILPAENAQNNLEIYAVTSPAEAIGGDFYDFFFLDSNRLALIIADASDKGIPAALLMAETKNSLKALMQSGNSLIRTFEFINKSLCENNEMSTFVTIFAAIINIKSGNLEFINAGHTPPLLSAGPNHKFEFINAPPHCALGVNEKSVYSTSGLILNKNDSIILYTDGVTDVTNVKNELFSKEGLKNLLNKDNIKNLPIKNILTNIQKNIKIFSNSETFSDDITLLGLRKI